MKKGCLISCVVVLVIFIVAVTMGGIFYYRGLAAPDPNNNETKLFSIEEGWSVSVIAKHLKEDNYIKSELVFQVYVFISGDRDKLQAGNFELSPAMSVPQVVDLLVKSKEKQIEIKIIEGQRLEEVARVVEEQGIKGDFVDRAKVANYKDKYSFLANVPGDKTLEGFLFPDTYKLNINSTVDDVIKKMLDNFDLKLKELPAPTNPMFSNLSDLVILASIVEREATKSNIERRRIAGVYLNRLTAQTYLQADPTVQYSKDMENYRKASDKDCFKFWQPITAQDYETVNGGYNTYKIKGLPPGPICSPSEGSLAAAFNPERNNYFYFFHTKDGAIVFSETAEEHQERLKAAN
ncbi:MAG: endolytic transglycosylase MltG [Candidatus Berkelbacteria bacterium]|nr:endolytic transglycosylase MltG [Candidatus Berkelbacteria bacterium]